ncbi:stage II sporulation protein P [Phosphitispora sp. TUW77]|uniref:stage II sporulation protein P n=1 Tax=Phosphitispora sp. TUW77 TaxID=3152361 RepID=UPI003AB50DC2
MNRRLQLIFGIIVMLTGIGLMLVPLTGLIPTVEQVSVPFLDRFVSGGFEQELEVGEYITVVDEKSGKLLDMTGRVVYVGDEFINENNEQYEITKVRGDKAFAKKTGVASGIVWKDEWDTVPAAGGSSMVSSTVNSSGGQAQIAIYHTHSDESYVPTDGTESQPANGGILKVGSSLAEKLQAKGITVADDKTPHEPHDANAYHRSRKTAVRLLKHNPVALLDIHRDGVPDPGFYSETIEGEDITKVRLVVGRQNPKMATNLQFAKDIKAYMDKNKPGLIKGIFIGKGNYNQDLGPRAILLEVGTYTNIRGNAEDGAAIFADALPDLLNLTAAKGTTSGQSGSAWSTLAWLVGTLLAGGAIFLFISTGSIKGVKSKLGELKKTEFANYFGLKKQTGDVDENIKDEDE